MSTWQILTRPGGSVLCSTKRVSICWRLILMFPLRGFVAGRSGVTAEDSAAWLDDLAAMDAGNRYFFSVTMFLFLAGRRP